MYVLRRDEKGNAQVLVGNTGGKRPLGRQWRAWIILKMDLYRNRIGGCGMNSFGSEWGPVAGSCKHGNEPSDSIKWELPRLRERILAC
jgi:hypothetical protein